MELKSAKAAARVITLLITNAASTSASAQVELEQQDLHVKLTVQFTAQVATMVTYWKRPHATQRPLLLPLPPPRQRKSRYQ